MMSICLPQAHSRWVSRKNFALVMQFVEPVTWLTARPSRFSPMWTRRLGRVRSVFLFIIALCTFQSSSPVWAASFDCAKAKSVAEKLVCSASELSILDEQLAKVYAEAGKRTIEPDRFKHEQRTWLNMRDQCTQEPSAAKQTACMRVLYEQRVQALSGTCWQHDSWQAGLLSRHAYIANGKEDVICNIMLENLNRFCGVAPEKIRSSYPYPPLDPLIASLSTVEWHAIDASEHLDWIEHALTWWPLRTAGTRLSRRDPSELWTYGQDKIKELIGSGQSQMWEARFDLSNDDIPDLVRYITFGEYVEVPGVGTIGKGIWMTLTNEETGLPYIDSGYVPVISMFSGYVVRYAGKTYLFGITEEGTEASLSEPWTSTHGGSRKREDWSYGSKIACMFKNMD